MYDWFHFNFIILVYQENFCWNIGLVTNLIAKSKLKSNSYPSTQICPVPQEYFRCVCPNSVIFKQYHHNTGIGGFLSHCGIPQCKCGILDSPKDLIDQVYLKSKTCIFHFILLYSVKKVYCRDIKNRAHTSVSIYWYIINT